MRAFSRYLLSSAGRGGSRRLAGPVVLPAGVPARFTAAVTHSAVKMIFRGRPEGPTWDNITHTCH